MIYETSDYDYRVVKPWWFYRVQIRVHGGINWRIHRSLHISKSGALNKIWEIQKRVARFHEAREAGNRLIGV